MRRINIAHHAHGTTVQIADDRMRHYTPGDQGYVTRYHYLPTPTSLTRLYRIVYHWPNQAAYVHTYQETFA